MRTFAALGAALLALSSASALAANEYAALGTLEREAVDEALKTMGVAIDDHPEGKLVGQVHIVNLEVFGKQIPPLLFLRAFNVFHATTRTEVMWREVLLRPGQRWDQDLVDETRRNLIDPFLSNAVVLLPVRSRVPGYVDLLVVTRDVWSLRLNSNFQTEITSTGNTILTLLSFSLSENNVAGLRKKAAVSFSMDQGAYEVGPTYVDPNLAGSHLTLTTAVRAIFSREASEFEGTRSISEFGYPLWSLATKWGASIAVEHNDSRRRRFFEDQLQVVCPIATRPAECYPWVYDRRDVETAAGVVRSFGRRVVQRITFGHEFDYGKTFLLSDFAGDELARQALLARFPFSEISSALAVRYRLFTPVYAEARDLDTFDFREDLRTGPSLEAKVAVARQELGSDNDFVAPTATAGFAIAPGGSYERLAIGYENRYQEGEFRDHVLQAAAYAASPKIGGLFRVIGDLNVGRLLHETRNRGFVAGSNTGLRAFQINEFSCVLDPTPCHARYLGHVEARTLPLHILFFRLGAVAFWDVGHAAQFWNRLGAYHDVGVGFRLLVPQIDPYVMRLDYAVALNGDNAGFPGRFTLGFFQVF